MIKPANQKLGLTIRGGSDQPGANPMDPTDEGIFISKVIGGGEKAGFLVVEKLRVYV